MRLPHQRLPLSSAAVASPVDAQAAGGVATVAVYALTMFVSAALLFLIQPMFARMVLPLMGGSPSVWNTAVVFFQSVLLAGSLYAHASTRRLGVRRQALLHSVLILIPLALLPIAVPAGWNPPSEGNPIPWLLALLFVAVGLVVTPGSQHEVVIEMEGS